MAGPHPKIWYQIDQKKFDRMLRGLVRRGRDLSPAFHAIGRMFRKSRKTIFALKSPGGYDDLNPLYKDKKIREKGFAYPILKYSGMLEKSLTNIGHPNNITIVEKKSFAFGTNVEYAKFHNSDKKPRKKIPLRKFVFWGPEAPRTMRTMTARTKDFSARAIKVIKNHIAREKANEVR